MPDKRRSPAGCFLKVVAALIILVLAGAVLYRIFERQLGILQLFVDLGR